MLPTLTSCPILKVDVVAGADVDGEDEPEPVFEAVPVLVDFSAFAATETITMITTTMMTSAALHPISSGLRDFFFGGGPWRVHTQVAWAVAVRNMVAAAVLETLAVDMTVVPDMVPVIAVDMMVAPETLAVAAVDTIGCPDMVPGVAVNLVDFARMISLLL